MAIIILQHSDIGLPGRLGVTLRDHGLKLDIRRPDKPASTPGVPTDLDAVQGLIILGGPQNVTDAAQYPWMQAELDLIKKAHAAMLPIVGICLGHQMIAAALGGQVAFRDKPGVGFETLSINTTGQVETILAGVRWQSPQFFACEQEVKQLPPGATLLASTPSIKNAIFRVGVRTFGFQPHFECDRPMLDALIASCVTAIAKSGTNADHLKSEAEKHYPTYARLSDRLCVNIATTCFPLQRQRVA